MSLFDRVRGRHSLNSSTQAVTTAPISGIDVEATTKGIEIDVAASPAAQVARNSLEEQKEKDIIEHPEEITKDAQPGLQKAEAVALVWSKTAVYATYGWIWLCFFVLSMQTNISGNIIYYAYADFALAPQISEAFVISSVLGGVLQLPIAKVLNIWGRAEGFLFFLGVLLVGLVVIATCGGPTSFAAGYTLYQIGYVAVNFILGIFIVDSSGLRNRAFAYAFIGLPTVCTAFTGPLAAQAFIEQSSWRWSYGCFIVIIFVIFTPLALVFKFYQRKAEKLGLFNKVSSGRTKWQSVVYYFHEFDVVGAFLLSAAFLLVLLPFSLEIYGYSGYSSASFIALIVIGILLFPAFAVWERYFATTQFIKWDLLKNRTVLGACVLASVIFFNWYCWDLYFYYFVEVVYNLDTTQTGYMTQTYGVGSTIWAILFGVWIRQSKHFKYVCLFFGAPLLMLGAGLMIQFRGNDSHIGYLVMCQIFIAVGGGTLVIGDEMAAMAAADHDGVPMVIAMLGLFSSMGGAIGNAVAAAIYSNTFPQALLDNLPEESLSAYYDIYLGGAATQMLYPPGDPTRDAIDYAYAYSQKYECITAAVVVVLAFPAIAFWKNYNVDRKQVKGNVI